MINCTKCANETRTSGLVTASGDVMLAGTIGADPQPILAQVCTACGYIELYAPQPLQRADADTQHVETTAKYAAEAPIPAV
jgi:predicted nucleic-acid-binding Zn-ribbon protein